jgi:steroid delta-isomerase-like uncharacterized protein
MNRIAVLLSATMLAITVGCAPSTDSARARNIAVVHRVPAELWSKGKVELIDELFADDFVGHFPEKTVHGREGLLDQVTSHRRSFPDWTEEVVDTIADRDRVVVRFRSSGTNLGEFLGRPPTGKHVEIYEAAIFRLRDGKIVEQWVFPDILSMQRQLSE